MKLFLFVLAFAIVVVHNANSQTCQWAQRIDGSQLTNPKVKKADSDGNVYIAGEFNSPTLVLNNGIVLAGFSGSDIYLAKYNSDGLCQWAQSISGVGNDLIGNLTVDNIGNLYITGNTLSKNINFNNAISINTNDSLFLFLAKYDPNGLCLWAERTSFGANAFSNDIEVDNMGNIFIGGSFYSTSLILNNAKSLTKTGKVDNFLAKYNTVGQCQWVKGFNKSQISYSYIEYIAIDSAGSLFIAGSFSGDTLWLSDTIFIPRTGSSNQCFFAKLDGNGNCLWAESVKGSNFEITQGIEVDRQGDIVIMGNYFYSNVSFNNGITLPFKGGRDIYLTKYNSNGLCQWAQLIGGGKDDYANSLTIDSNNNIYFAGLSQSDSIFYNNDVVLAKGLSNSGYYAKYNSNGLCQYAEMQGVPSNIVYTNSVAVDNNGSVFVSGIYSSDLTLNNGIALNSNNSSNLFIAKYYENIILDAPKNYSKNVFIDAIVKWRAAQTASSYRVQLSNDSTFASNVVESLVTDTSYTFQGLNFGRDYFWRAKANRLNDSTYWSSVWKFTTIDSILEVPICVFPTNNELGISRELAIKWTPTVYLGSYRFQLSSDSNFVDFIENLLVNDTSKYIDGLNYGTKYFWRVKAYSSTDSSDWSEIFNFSTAKKNYVPYCSWAEKIAGTNIDNAKDIAVDELGNVYTVGEFRSDNLIFNNGKELELSSGSDVFLAKYDSNGVCLWAKSVKGKYNETAANVLLDKNNFVYITGAFNSDTIFFDNQLSIITSADNQLLEGDGFFAKYDSIGNLIWAEKIGGTRGDDINSIAVDSTGDIYVSGVSRYSTKLIFNNGIVLQTDNPVIINYLAKYDKDGICQWAKQFGYTDLNCDQSIAIDNSNNVIFSGAFYPDTIKFGGGINLTNSGFLDVFISKFDTSGNCIWANKIAGDESDFFSDVTIDNNDNVYAVGYFSSNTLEFTSDYTINKYYGYDAYLAKYNGDGEFQWSQKIWGSDNDKIFSIVNDRFGDVYISGQSFSDTLYFNNGIFLTANTVFGYIAKYNSIGTCLWALKLNSNEGDTYPKIDLDSNLNMYVSGNFGNKQLILNNGIVLTHTSPNDAYIAKYGPGYSPIDPPALQAPVKNSIKVALPTNLVWTGPENATSYRIQVSNDYNFSSLQVDEELISTSFSFDEIANDATNYWRVKTYAAADSSIWSEVWSFSTLVQAINLVSPANDSIEVDIPTAFIWEISERAINYRLQVSTSESFSNIVVDIYTSSNNATVNDLIIDKKYYWRVKVISSIDSSAWSERWGFTTEGKGSFVPILYLPLDNETGISMYYPRLFWYRSINTESYRFQLSADSSFSPALKDVIVSSTEISTDVLNGNTIYYWRVKAFSATDSSDWSEVRKFTTLAVSVSEFESTIQIFPQPASELLNIAVPEDLEPATISIFSQTGNKLFQSEQNEFGNTIQISINYLPSGVYMLVINSNGKTYCERIIITR